MEWVLVSAFGSLAVIVLWATFSHLMAQDAAEAAKNREEACGYHQWGRVAGGGLRCAACGKIPGG